MGTSVYSRELDAAMLQADRLGHKLAKVSVQRCVARTACERCGNSLTVMFHSPVVVMGTAIDKECGNGEKNIAPEVEPTPPTGEAKALPVAPRKTPNSRTWTPDFDDVPFPTDADCLVRR